MASELSDITRATISFCKEITEKLYPLANKGESINYDRFTCINIPDNPYYSIEKDGLHIKTYDGQIVIKPESVEYMLDKYVTKGFSVAEMLRERNPINGKAEYELLSSFPEHSFVHALSATRQSELMIQRMQGVSDEFKSDVSRLSKMSTMYHDIGMSNGLSYIEDGIAGNTKEFRSNHATLGAYMTIADSQKVFGCNIQEMSEKYKNGELSALESKQLKDSYMVSMAIASHSKSNSGLYSFSQSGIDSFMDKMEIRFDVFNKATGQNIKFDRNIAQEIFNDPQSKELFKEVSRITSMSDSLAHSENDRDVYKNQIGGDLKVYKVGDPEQQISEERPFSDQFTVMKENDIMKELENAGANMDNISPHQPFYCTTTENDTVDANMIVVNDYSSKIILGERLCHAQEEYYNSDGAKYTFNIGPVSPYDEMSREAVSKYIEERMMEQPRYYMDKELKVEIICDAQYEKEWANIIFSGKIPQKDEYGQTSYVFSNEISENSIVRYQDENGNEQSYTRDSIISKFNEAMGLSNAEKDNTHSGISESGTKYTYDAYNEHMRNVRSRCDVKIVTK